MQTVLQPAPPVKAAAHTSKVDTSIGRIAIWLAAIALCAKAFGFAEKLIVAHFFGTGPQADVYFASIGMVMSIVFLIKELIYPSVLPVFARTINISFQASSSLFRQIFLPLLLGLICMSVIMAAFSNQIVSIIVPGFSADKKAMTSTILKLFAPGCLFLSLSTLTYTILNCRKNFFTASVSDASVKLVIAVGLLAIIPFFDIYSLPVVVGFAAAALCIVQIMFIPESRTLFQKIDFKFDERSKMVLQLMMPLVIGVIFSHACDIVDNMLASKLPTGQLSYLGYSKKLIDAFLLVGPVSLVTVTYSRLSHLANDPYLYDFKQLYLRSMRLILFVSVPVSILIVMLREPVVSVIFERGQFTSLSAHGTSQALFVYGLGIVALSLEGLVVFGFYALSNTKLPVKAGICGVLLDIAVAVSLIGILGFKAIALGFVVSKIIKVAFLLWAMERKLKCFENKVILIFVTKLATAALVAAASLYLVKEVLLGQASAAVLGLALPALTFTIIFAGVCYMLEIEELYCLAAMFQKSKPIKSYVTEEAQP